MADFAKLTELKNKIDTYRPKFFKAVSAMMVIVAILAVVQLAFPGQSAYARYSNAWAIINIIWAVLTVLYQKQQLQTKKHA